MASIKNQVVSWFGVFCLLRVHSAASAAQSVCEETLEKIVHQVKFTFDGSSDDGPTTLVCFVSNKNSEVKEKWSIPVMNFRSLSDLAEFSTQTAFYVHEKVPISIRTGQFVKSVVVIWLGLEEDISTFGITTGKLKGLLRQSKFVFIGQKSQVTQILHHPEVARLKDTVGIISDTCNLLGRSPTRGKMLEEFSTAAMTSIDRKTDILRNKLIRISGSKMPPYCDVKVVGGRKVFSGSNFNIIQASSVKLNYTYTLEAPAGKSPGSRLPNGTWIGMLADVLAGEADLTIVNAYNVERFRVIDYTSYFTVTTLTFVTSHPQKSVSLAALALPFDSVVWLLISLTFVTACGAYYFHYYYNPYNKVDEKTIAATDAFFMPLSISLRQPLPAERGVRLLSMHWAFFVFLIGAGYESNLMSYLTFPEIEPVPKNFVELAENPAYSLHFNIFSNIGRSLFRKGTSNFLKKLDARYLTEVTAVDCVLLAFTDRKSACIGWNDILNSAMAKNLTLELGMEPLSMSQHALLNNWLAFGLRKDSEFTEAFSYVAASYAETGLVQKWKEDFVDNYGVLGKKWMATQKESTIYKSLNYLAARDETLPKPFQMPHVRIAFIILLVGLAISSIAFALERTWTRNLLSTITAQEFSSSELDLTVGLPKAPSKARALWEAVRTISIHRLIVDNGNGKTLVLGW